MIMLSKIMNIFKIFFFIFIIILNNNSLADEKFNRWLTEYKKYAEQNGVSKKTINIAFKDVRFLKKIISYDRKQPEFIEKTNIYISKRITKKKSIQQKGYYAKIKNY